MGRKNSNARRIEYTKLLTIRIAKPIFRTIKSSKNIRFGGERLINPSVGKLRAWADPIIGVNIVIGVSY